MDSTLKFFFCQYLFKCSTEYCTRSPSVVEFTLAVVAHLSHLLNSHNLRCWFVVSLNSAQGTVTFLQHQLMDWYYSPHSSADYIWPCTSPRVHAVFAATHASLHAVENEACREIQEILSSGPVSWNDMCFLRAWCILNTLRVNGFQPWVWKEGRAERSSHSVICTMRITLRRPVLSKRSSLLCLEYGSNQQIIPDINVILLISSAITAEGNDMGSALTLTATPMIIFFKFKLLSKDPQNHIWHKKESVTWLANQTSRQDPVVTASVI